MRSWNLEQRVRLDLFFTAALCGIWALALCAGALLDSTQLIDMGFVALVGALACLEAASVRTDLLDHVREAKPEEGA